MFFEPNKNHPFTPNFLSALIFPRPIGWISSISKNGVPNLSPYSFFNAISYIPPQIMFAATANHSDGGLKDTIRNILDTREFVVNLAIKKLKNEVNETSIDAPHDIDEFNFFKIKKRKSKIVKPPSVADSPINLECKLIRKINLKTKSKNKNQNKMIIGEVIGVRIENRYIKNGRINSLMMKAISRMGYSEYSEVDSKFLMTRPKWIKL